MARTLSHMFKKKEERQKIDEEKKKGIDEEKKKGIDESLSTSKFQSQSFINDYSSTEIPKLVYTTVMILPTKPPEINISEIM